MFVTRCSAESIGCFLLLLKRAVQYHPSYGWTRLRGHSDEVSDAALVVDCAVLVGDRPVRCNPDGVCDARRRHAPQLDGSFRNVAAVLDSVGDRDSTRAASSNKAFCESLEGGWLLAATHGSVRGSRLRVRRVDKHLGQIVEPICARVGGSVSAALVGKVLWGTSFVRDSLWSNSSSRSHSGLARASGSPANRNGASQRAAVESSTQLVAEADRASLFIQRSERDRRAGSRREKRCSNKHDSGAERLFEKSD